MLLKKKWFKNAMILFSYTNMGTLPLLVFNTLLILKADMFWVAPFVLIIYLLFAWTLKEMGWFDYLASFLLILILISNATHWCYKIQDNVFSIWFLKYFKALESEPYLWLRRNFSRIDGVFLQITFSFELRCSCDFMLYYISSDQNKQHHSARSYVF